MNIQNQSHFILILLLLFLPSLYAMNTFASIFEVRANNISILAHLRETTDVTDIKI